MTNYFKTATTSIIILLLFTLFSIKASAQKIGEKVAAGPVCVVPVGYTTCSSSCTFTDCCVVWDPKKETGGCACMFGISSCKTAAILQAKTPGQVSTSIRKVVFHLKKFEDFLGYCKRNNISVQTIEYGYQGNIVAKASSPTLTDSEVDPDSLDLFILQYESFINGLNPSQLNLVKSYLGSK